MAVFKDFHPTQMSQLLEDSEAIKSSIRNLLTLKIHSIFGIPELGSDLDKFVFEQMDFVTVHQIEENVMSLLYTNEPRINNISVNIDEQPEYNRIYIEVQFNIKAMNTTEQVTIKIR